MAKPGAANVKITRHGMAESVFRHAYGGTAPIKAEPSIAVPATPGQTGGLRTSKNLPSPSAKR